MNEIALTYLVNNLVLITISTIFIAAIVYQIAVELKKVLTNKK